MSGSWLYDVKSAGEKRMVISLLTLSSCPVDGKQPNAKCSNTLYQYIVYHLDGHLDVVTEDVTCPDDHDDCSVSMLLSQSGAPHITSALLRVPPPTERRHSGHYSCRGRGLSPPTLHQPQSLTRISNKHSSLIQPANKKGFDFTIT